jgi:hypothetical protein
VLYEQLPGGTTRLFRSRRATRSTFQIAYASSAAILITAA